MFEPLRTFTQTNFAENKDKHLNQTIKRFFVRNHPGHISYYYMRPPIGVESQNQDVYVF